MKRSKLVNHITAESRKLAQEQTKVHNNEIKQDLAKVNVEKLLDGLSNEQKRAMLEQIRYRKARESYIEYLKLVFQEYKWTPFHIYLAKVCETIVKKVENGENVRLVISTPPQCGKSETITKTLPSWFVGRNPDKNAILTAYNEDYAIKYGDANRKKTSEFGKKVFGIEISDSQNSKNLYEIKNHRGMVKSVGFMGGITGNRGDVIIIDDPYKNSIEANSPTTRKQIEQVFRDSIMTRLQPKGSALILVQTRWHENDLAGVLSNEGYIVINIPCVCESDKDPIVWKENGQVRRRLIGETLCPQLGFDAEWAERTRVSVGEKVWNALYQGHPTIDGGDIFKREWIKFYTENTLPTTFDEIIMSCDLSFGGVKKENDPCALQVWGRVGANHYLLKRVKKRMNFNDMCNAIKVLCMSYPQARKKIVEKKANGQAIIDSLNSVIGGFIAYDPKMTDKVGRANAITPYFQANNVFFPNNEIDNTIDEMVEEMLSFPNGTHDDEVDAMTQYLNCFEYKNGGKILIDNSYRDLADAWKGIKI